MDASQPRDPSPAESCRGYHAHLPDRAGEPAQPLIAGVDLYCEVRIAGQDQVRDVPQYR